MGAKYAVDSIGHYARPDVFTLLVNEGEALPVKTASSLSPDDQEFRKKLEDLAFKFQGGEQQLCDALRELLENWKSISE